MRDGIINRCFCGAFVTTAGLFGSEDACSILHCFYVRSRFRRRSKFPEIIRRKEIAVNLFKENNKNENENPDT